MQDSQGDTEKSEDLQLAASPPQGDLETVVKFWARFKRYESYLDMNQDGEDVAEAFVGALRLLLISGPDIFRGSVLTGHALIRSIVKLVWNQEGGPLQVGAPNVWLELTWQIDPADWASESNVFSVPHLGSEMISSSRPAITLESRDAGSVVTMATCAATARSEGGQE